MAAIRPELAGPLRALSERVVSARAERDPLIAERALEDAARDLRATWLRGVAGETAAILRSPTEKEQAQVSRRHDGFGYERDLRPEALEDRCAAFFDPPPSPWRAAHVLCSSGQAALTATLMTLAEDAPDRLSVAHIGRYFETRSLIERTFKLATPPNNASCVIVEPVACDGAFSTNDVAAALAHASPKTKAVLVDVTLTRRGDGLEHALITAPRNLLVLRLVSGLKLLQQGLELANVGIVSVYARDAGRARAFTDALTEMRTLTGAGLRLGDELALEAPFFLDRAATDAYEGAIFAHNAALAEAVAEDNRVFAPFTHPPSAPYCTLRLRDGMGLDLETLTERIAAEADARGLLFDRGGSFGFRGHRFDLVEPDDGGKPFLRVAMGRRSGPSYEGVLTLMREVAAGRLT